MNKKSAEAEQSVHVPSSGLGAGLQIALTIGDTTWRMFVPLILALLLGTAADNVWHTKPWGLAIGIIVGVASSAFFVIRQLKRVEKE